MKLVSEAPYAFGVRRFARRLRGSAAGPGLAWPPASSAGWRRCHELGGPSGHARVDESLKIGQGGGIMKDHVVPHYQLLFESYAKAQNVQKDGHETKLDKFEASQTKKGKR